MKICPGCQKLIQDDSTMCPYCLYSFEVKKPTTLPSMTLDQKPLIDSKLYTQKVEAERKKSRKKWVVVIAIILLVFVGMVYVAFNGKSGGEHDNSFMTISPSPVINEEQEMAAFPSPEAEMEKEIIQQKEYVIPDSDRRYLSEKDLERLSPEERRLARNEIYARHHRLFDDEGLQDYFNNCSWYEGKILPEEFTEDYAAKVFNEYELYNKDFILDYENKNK